MRAWILLASFVTAGCACGTQGHTPPPEPAYVCRDAGAGEMPTCGCRAEPDDECPCNCSGLPGVCEPDCELCPPLVCQWFLPEPLPTPWWFIDPPHRCDHTSLAGIEHDRPEALDDCELGPRNTATLPTECCVPTSGVAICWNDVWTQTCLRDDDCPEGMGCGAEVSFTGGRLRFCQKRCERTGDPAECVRCDYACGDDGLCAPGPPVEHGPPCEADCQCYGGPDRWGNPYNHCGGGFCRATGADRRYGVCNEVDDGTSPLPDDICACLGGTCEPTPGGGCCRGPDGHVAGHSSDPICSGAGGSP